MLWNLRALAASISLASLASIAAVAACSEAPPPATPPGPPAAPAPVASAGPVMSAAPAAVPATGLPATWSKDMSHQQQAEFMKKNVMPAMGPVFQGHDASRYASFGCKTCHGPEFKTPTAFLPHLTMKGGNLTAFAEKPEISKFMAESVTPKMATAMGLPPFDMKTHQGFGCGGCHTIDMK